MFYSYIVPEGSFIPVRINKGSSIKFSADGFADLMDKFGLIYVLEKECKIIVTRGFGNTVCMLKPIPESSATATFKYLEENSWTITKKNLPSLLLDLFAYFEHLKIPRYRANNKKFKKDLEEYTVSLHSLRTKEALETIEQAFLYLMTANSESLYNGVIAISLWSN